MDDVERTQRDSESKRALNDGEADQECPCCWEPQPFLLVFKCSHTLCVRCHRRDKCPFCHEKVIPRLPPPEEFRLIIEREDPRVISVLAMDDDIRNVFITRLIAMVSAELPLKQLLYIRSICAMGGPSGTLGVNIAHDLNDLPRTVSRGTSSIRFDRCRELLRGSDSPLFQEIHTEAINRLTPVGKDHPIRYVGIDLIKTTLITEEGIRMNAIQYLVHCKWLIEDTRIEKLVEEYPRRLVLASALSLKELGYLENVMTTKDCIPQFMKILRQMTLADLERKFSLPDRLEDSAHMIYRVVKDQKRINVADVRNEVNRMYSWNPSNNFYDILKYVLDQKRFGIRLEGTILIYE